jgi:SSS family solute:Na+ symporter
MDYIQLLFSFFNAPLFATFIIGMFWKRMTPWAGFWGLLAGTAGAAIAHYGNQWGWFDLGSAQAAAFWGAIAAFVLDAIVSVAVTFVTKPKPVEELQNLVYGMAAVDEDDTASEHVWYRRPYTLAAGALGLTAILSFIFA